MSVTQSSDIRWVSKPGSVGLSEKPYPGMAGTTTWNAWSAEPPKRAGSVSGPMTLAYSSIELGQPLSSSRGRASLVWRPLMDEVDIESVDVGRVLVEGVQSSLVCPPVILVSPVLNQLAQVGQVGAVVPGAVDELVRKTGGFETSLQIGEHLVRYIDHEGIDIGVVGLLPGCRCDDHGLPPPQPPRGPLGHAGYVASSGQYIAGSGTTVRTETDLAGRYN